jgi:hypothetical protein
VFVAAVTFWPSPYLVTIRGYTYRHTDCWQRFMKYAVEMGSGAMIYKSSSINIVSGIQKLIGGIHREHGDHISLLLFFQYKESRVIKMHVKSVRMVQMLCLRSPGIKWWLETMK